MVALFAPLVAQAEPTRPPQPDGSATVAPAEPAPESAGTEAPPAEPAQEAAPTPSLPVEPAPESTAAAPPSPKPAEPPPAPPPKPRKKPGIAVRTGIGPSLVWRPEWYSVRVNDPVRVRRGEFATEGSRIGTALTIHGGVALTLGPNFSAGLEYRSTIARLSKEPGAFEELDYAMDRRLTLHGWAVYGQGRIGHLVASGSFGLPTLVEKLPKDSPLSFGSDGERELRFDTYELGGTLGYQGWFVGTYPAAFGWHVALTLGVVGFNPFVALQALGGGPLYFSDGVEAMSLGCEAGIDFN